MCERGAYLASTRIPVALGGLYTASREEASKTVSRRARGLAVLTAMFCTCVCTDVLPFGFRERRC